MAYTSYRGIDKQEKNPFVTASEVATPAPSISAKTASSLYVYQTLVGDTSAKKGEDDDSLYHDIIAREKKARRGYVIWSIIFGACILLQIALCLAIAAGAQLGFSMMAITVAASVNTAVAALIAVLKGLGLPEKRAIERHQLHKVAEKIRYTTRKLKAGIEIDAAKEADAVLKQHDDIEDAAEILRNAGDAASITSPTALMAGGEKKMEV